MCNESQTATTKPAAAKSPCEVLLEAVGRAGEADLDQLRAKIADLEKEIASLREAAKLIEHRLHGKPKRKSPARRKAADNPGRDGEPSDSDRPPESLGVSIYRIVSRQGPTPVDEIAGRFGVSDRAILVAAGRNSTLLKRLGKAPDFKIAAASSP